MAGFAPEGPTQAGSQRDFTNQAASPSSGTPGWVTSTVTNLIDSTVKFTDAQIKDNISATARDYKESEDKSLLRGQQEFLDQSAAIDSLPEGVVNKQQSLLKLKNAYENGVLSESAYYSRLDAASREMRSRYPGYVDQIDQSMSRLTGVNPANAVARDILSRIQKVNKDPDRSEAQQVERTLRDTFGFQPPANMPLEQQKELAANFRKTQLLREEQKQDLEMRKSTLGLATDVDKYNLDKADKAITQGISTTTQAALGGIFNPTINRDGIRQPSIISQMEDAVVKGQSFSDDLKNQAVAAGPRITSAYRQAAMQHVNSLGGLITNQQREEIVRRYTDEGDRYIKALVSGDVGALTLTKKRNEAQLEDGAFILRTENDTVRNLATLGKATGGDTTRLLEVAMSKADIKDGKGTSLKTYTETVLSNYIMSGIPGSVQNKQELKSPSELAELARMKGINPATFINDSYGKAQKLVADKTLPINIRTSYLEFLTGPKMDNFTASFTTTADKEKAYATIVNPDTIKIVRELEKTVPGSVDKHNNTIIRNGMVVLNSQMDTVKQWNDTASSPVIIKYNADKATFVVDKNPNYVRVPGLSNPTINSTADNIANRLNVTLERMSFGLIDKNSTNPKIEDINKIIEGTGFSFTPMKKPETTVKQFQDKAPQ